MSETVFPFIYSSVEIKHFGNFRHEKSRMLKKDKYNSVFEFILVLFETKNIKAIS